MAAQLILKVSLFCHQAEYLLHCVTLMFLYLVSHSPCNILKYASLVFVKSSIICIPNINKQKQNTIEKKLLTTPQRRRLCTEKEWPWAQARWSGVLPRASLADMLTPLFARAWRQPSCPRMAAIWAGVHPRGVVTVASAPCHSNQWRHCKKWDYKETWPPNTISHQILSN